MPQKRKNTLSNPLNKPGNTENPEEHQNKEKIPLSESSKEIVVKLPLPNNSKILRNHPNSIYSEEIYKSPVSGDLESQDKEFLNIF